MLLLAIDAMERYGLSAYDAVYVALAQATEAGLATLDRHLAQAATEARVVVEPEGSGRLAERRAEYTSTLPPSPSWARSALVGRHIAELRRQAVKSGAVTR